MREIRDVWYSIDGLLSRSGKSGQILAHKKEITRPKGRNAGQPLGPMVLRLTAPSKEWIMPSKVKMQRSQSQNSLLVLHFSGRVTLRSSESKQGKVWVIWVKNRCKVYNHNYHQIWGLQANDSSLGGVVAFSNPPKWFQVGRSTSQEKQALNLGGRRFCLEKNWSHVRISFRIHELVKKCFEIKG